MPNEKIGRRGRGFANCEPRVSRLVDEQRVFSLLLKDPSKQTAGKSRSNHECKVLWLHCFPCHQNILKNLLDCYRTIAEVSVKLRG